MVASPSASTGNDDREQNGAKKSKGKGELRKGPPPQASPLLGDGVLRRWGKVRSRVHRQRQGRALCGEAAALAGGQLRARQSDFLIGETHKRKIEKPRLACRPAPA